MARLDILPHADNEFYTLLHDFQTSELDPTVLDTDLIHPIHDDVDFLPHKALDDYGDFCQFVQINHLSFFQRLEGHNTIDSIVNQCALAGPSTHLLKINKVMLRRELHTSLSCVLSSAG
jgi:hypothetical protein